jgi:hypothetical protein
VDKPRTDFVWPAATGNPSPRHLFIHDELRYAKRSNQIEVVHDGFLNYHWLLSPADLGRPMVMLEAGINAPAEVAGPDGSRRALIATVRAHGRPATRATRGMTSSIWITATFATSATTSQAPSACRAPPKATAYS